MSGIGPLRPHREPGERQRKGGGRRLRYAVFLVLLSSALAVTCVSCGAASPTPTLTRFTNTPEPASAGDAAGIPVPSNTSRAISTSVPSSTPALTSTQLPTSSTKPTFTMQPTKHTTTEPTQPPTDTPEPTLAPTATATPEPSPVPSLTPSPIPTTEPSTTPPPSPTEEPTDTLEPSPTPVPATPTPTTTKGLPRIQTQVIISGLEIPWAVDFAPDGRVFITERPGRIRVVVDGQLVPEPWMTLDVAAVGEGRLLGLALDPEFERNGFVYVAYTYSAGGANLANRLVRLRDDPSSNRGTLDAVLLEGVPGWAVHDGGRVKFGPDGKIYWSMGDVANTALAQDLAALNGKILRLNSDGSVPEDNPFPNSPIYSYGHRNPQGLAWHPISGWLYATEHGPSGRQLCCRDEVNYIEPGKNYGWPSITGGESSLEMQTPVLHSGSAVTWAPSGAAFVSQGPWSGSLFFAGLRGETLYRLELDAENPRRAEGLDELLSGQYGRLRDVVEGPDGSLYVLTSNRDGRGNPVPEDDRLVRVTIR